MTDLLPRARAYLADNPVAAIIIGTAVMLAAGEAIAPGFASPTQIAAQLTVAAILGIVAAGQGLVILSGREGIDLSVASVMSLAALTAGNVMGGDNALTLPALAASLAIGVTVGLFNGVGVAIVRIPPLVMTLGTAGVITGLLVVLTQGQTSGAASPLLQSFIQKPFLLGLPGLIWVWGAVILAIHLMLTSTRFGFNLYAVGSNDLAAELSGVRVRWTRVATYGASGLFSGFGGFCLLGYTGTVFVGASEQYILPSVIAVVIGGTSLAGGRGSYNGTAVGAVFLTVLTAFLTTVNIDAATRQVLYGLVLIAFMTAYGREAKAR
ncbi:MAG: ABC transporter permease [Gemmobacter sp.]